MLYYKDIPYHIIVELRSNKKRYIRSSDIQKKVDSTGKKICKWCLAPLPKRRRMWCSDECSDKLWRLSAENIRWTILDKSGGKCAICDKIVDVQIWKRFHAIETKEEMDSLVSEFPHLFKVSTYRRFGWEPRSHFYEIDHIIPMCEGGWTGPDNLRALCIPCHQEETRKLRKRLKK